MRATVSEQEQQQSSRLLRVVLPLDGSASFLLPALLLAAIPAMLLFQPPIWLVGSIVIGSAVVLASCGAVMAAAMARTMRSGTAEHPEMARFLLSSKR